MPKKLDFSAFEGADSAGDKRAPALDFSAFELPLLPDDPTLMPADAAESLIRQYKFRGKDPGIEVLYGFGAEGSRQKFVRPKTYFGAAKPEPTGDPTFDKAKEKLKADLDASYAKELQSQTSVMEQFAEGLIRPTENLALGAIEIATGDEQPSTLMTNTQVKYGHLSPAQKVSYTLGAAVGYVGPGVAINSVTKGLLKIGTTMAGKAKLVQQASQIVSPQIAKLAKMGTDAIQKLPTETLRNIVAEGSSMFFKNGASLAVEGAAWGALESRGELDKAIEGAVVFPLAGAALAGAAPAVVAGGKAVARGAGKLISKFTPAGEEAVIQAPSKSMVTRQPVKETGMERAEHVKNRDVAEKAWNSEHHPNEVLLRTQDELPPGLRTEDYLLLKKTETARLTAFEEVNSRVQSAKIFGHWKHETEQAGKIGKQLDALHLQREALTKRLADTKGLKIEEVLPKTIDDLKLSYSAKSHLEDTFGSLQGVPKQAEMGEMITTLYDNGLNMAQATSVAKQMMLPKIVTKKLTPHKAIEVGVSSEKLRQVERQIARLERHRDRYLSLAKEVEKKPGFTKEVDESLVKMRSEEVQALIGDTYRDKLEKLGVPIGSRELRLPFSKVKIFGKEINIGGRALRSLMNQSERDNFIEMQTHIPVFQLRQKLIEGVNVRSHLNKAMMDAYNPDAMVKELKQIGVDGHDLTQWMRYTRSTKEGVKWDPSAIKEGSYEIPAFDPKTMGPEPAKEVKDILFKIREAMDRTHEMQASAGIDIGYRPGYVPILKKHLEATGIGRYRKTKVNAPSFTKHRYRGLVPEGEESRHELDFYNWFPHTIRGGIKSAAFPNVSEEINSALFHFKNMGYGQYAEEFLKQVSTSLGHKAREETIEWLVTEAVNKNSHWNKAATQLYRDLSGEKVPLGEDLARGFQHIMYYNLIGVNPHNLLQQFMSPEMVTGAEIGLKWSLAGRAQAYGRVFSKEAMTDLERVKTQLYPENMDAVLFGEVQGKRRKWLEMISKSMGLPGWPGMKAFSAIDQKNREAAFLGAIAKWRAARKSGKVNEAIEHLLEGEKSQIAMTWEKYGEQAAMDRFGLIISKRSNYAYTMMEQGEAFQGSLGRLVTFPQFGVNQWMRHIEAVRYYKKTGKAAPLTALIGYGVGGAVAMKYLFGVDFYQNKINVPPGMNIATLELSGGIPQSAMLGLGNLSPLTPFTAVMGGKAMPHTRVLQQYKKYFGEGDSSKKPTKKDDDFFGIEGVVGIRPKKDKRKKRYQ